MQKKILSVFIVTVIAATCLMPSAAAKTDFGFDVPVSANAFYLENLDTGIVVAENNADAVVHPASTTKIMSVALAMELCSDLSGTMVTVPDDVWSSFEGLDVSHAGLVAGEVVPMIDLLHCMMLQSANEAAVAVASYFGYDDFLAKMNEKATQLGCQNTHFTSPHGAFVQDHYTTARDMAIITKWAMSVPGFYEISQKARYDMPATNKNDAKVLTTKIWLQDPSSRFYTSYIKGIKTGTLTEAGRCLVSTAEKNGMSYLLVLLGGSFTNSDDIWPDGQSAFTETVKLYSWAFSMISLSEVINPEAVLTDISLRYASHKDVLLLYPEKSIYTLIPNGTSITSDRLQFTYNLPESVKAPISSGDVIGTASISLDGETIGEVNLISREDVKLDVFVKTMDTISEIIFSTPGKIVLAVLAAIVLLYIYYVLVLIPRAQKKRRRKKTTGR